MDLCYFIGNKQRLHWSYYYGYLGWDNRNPPFFLSFEIAMNCKNNYANSLVNFIGFWSIPKFSLFARMSITALTTLFGFTVLTTFNKYFLNYKDNKNEDNL